MIQGNSCYTIHFTSFATVGVYSEAESINFLFLKLSESIICQTRACSWEGLLGIEIFHETFSLMNISSINFVQKYGKKANRTTSTTLLNSKPVIGARQTLHCRWIKTTPVERETFAPHAKIVRSSAVSTSTRAHFVYCCYCSLMLERNIRYSE